MYILEKDLLILKQSFLYLNSKGKATKRKPKIIKGAFYIFEVEYAQAIYNEKYFVSSEKLKNIKDFKSFKNDIHKIVLIKILKDINKSRS